MVIVHHNAEQLTGKSIVFVSFLEPWSLGRDVGAPSFYETLKAYCNAGAEVHYLTHEKPGLAEVEHATQIDAGIANLTVHRFRLPMAQCFAFAPAVQAKLNRLVLFPIFAARELTRLVDQIDCDLIYAYEQSAILAAYVSNRSRRTHVLPVVNRYQGTILGARYSDFWFAVRKLESLLALKAPANAYIMTDDGTLGDRALKYWNPSMKPSNLLFVRNGIDMSIKDMNVDRQVYLSGLGLDPDDVFLLTVSRLTDWKRVDRAITIIAELKDRCPNLKLLICGSGPARPALERLAAEKSVTDKVIFLGAQPRKEVANLLHSADIFLSLYDVSNCGNPLFEAQLVGKPLVTLDNGATATVIKDGINGRIIDPRDEGSLPDIVAQLIDDHELRATLSEGAKSWSRKELRSWSQRMELEIDWLRDRIPGL